MEINYRIVALLLFVVFWGFLCFGTGMAIGVISKPPTYRIDQMVSETAPAQYMPGSEYVPPAPKVDKRGHR